jgi:hypothetical protein
MTTHAWSLATRRLDVRCLLSLDGNFAVRRYEGPDGAARGEATREWILNVLARGSDPEGLADRDGLSRTLAEARAGLDGRYSCSSGFLRFVHGQPFERGGPCD